MKRTSIDVFRFEVAEGVSEYHVMLRATNPYLSYKEQVDCLLEDYSHLLRKELDGAVPVFKRFFLSDAANQADYLYALYVEGMDCPLSVIEQPPLDGTKVAMWVYLQKGV